MSIITLSEVKTFVDEGSTDYDTYISSLIPEIEENICRYCNTYFEDEVIYRESGSAFEFIQDSDTGDYITDDQSDFSTAGFLEGDDIVILGSGSNDGIHQISTCTGSVAAGQIMLDTADAGTLREIDQDDSYRWPGVIRINRINWPGGIKPFVAKAIWYQIEKSKPTDEKSERIDDYAVTYMGGNEYPERIVKAFDRYKRPAFR